MKWILGVLVACTVIFIVLEQIERRPRQFDPVKLLLNVVCMLAVLIAMLWLEFDPMLGTPLELGITYAIVRSQGKHQSPSGKLRGMSDPSQHDAD